MTDRRSVLSAAAFGLGAAAAAGVSPSPAAAQQQPAAYRPLAGRIGFVTGGARGIGRATAEELARLGADVALVDIADPHGVAGIAGYRLATRDELEQAARQLRGHGVRALSIIADVRDAAAMRTAAERAVDELGGIDIVVANAGVWAPDRPGEVAGAGWAAQLDVNLTGVLHTVEATLPAMRRREGGGRVVIVSSVNARGGSANSVGYAVSKWGVTGLMKSLALALGPDGITVNCVAPSAVDTVLLREGLMASARGIADPAEQERAVQAGHPLPVGILEPRAVAQAIAFLAGPGAANISGATIDVSAGRAAENVA